MTPRCRRFPGILQRTDYLAVPHTALAVVHDHVAAAALPDQLSRFPRGCLPCPMCGARTPRAIPHNLRAALDNLPATLPLGHDVRFGPMAKHRCNCCTLWESRGLVADR